MLSSRLTPKFIKAPSEEALQRAFLELQIIKGVTYTIITIYPTGKGVCLWYYDRREALKDLK